MGKIIMEKCSYGRPKNYFAVNCRLFREIIVVHLLRELLLQLFISRLPNGPLGLSATLNCPSPQVGHLKIKKANHHARKWLNAQALFAYLHDGAGLNTTPSQPLGDDRDANGNDTNVFASDREIPMTDADAGPALKTPPMQEIQFFIMRLMQLLTGRNTIAIDFWANSSADAGLQGANFACTGGEKTRRGIIAPNPEQHREQPFGNLEIKS
ncbi:MAG: hypothetical protein EZS28_030792 [Streblomastix strix]|uniref:Uncharacterized protein n=1 Tax=Streblomastix strix TaxID=222440 RepID=A0A5J4UU42_9EUKA|nr:MAG: hypothetical protein EZS28_030792 [Streblomastix strix]